MEPRLLTSFIPCHIDDRGRPCRLTRDDGGRDVAEYVARISREAGMAEAIVRARGNGHLLRQSYVATAGHCTFSPAESEAAILTMVDRLETGRWEGTRPKALNRRVRALDPLGAPGRFVAFAPPRFNRPYCGGGGN